MHNATVAWSRGGGVVGGLLLFEIYNLVDIHTAEPHMRWKDSSLRWTIYRLIFSFFSILTPSAYTSHSLFARDVPEWVVSVVQNRRANSHFCGRREPKSAGPTVPTVQDQQILVSLTCMFP